LLNPQRFKTAGFRSILILVSMFSSFVSVR